MPKKSDGGKGSSPRPFTDKEQYDKNFSVVFGESILERKKREEALRLSSQDEKERLSLYKSK
jgi:hypothetical protein